MGSITTDIWTGLAFCTRLPLKLGSASAGNGLARAAWTFPLIGVLVGLFAALIYWLADGLDLLPFVSATLAIVAALLLTGALHEDGLADTVDGFGGRTRERKLEIMRDSRTGTYGVSALVSSFMLRAGALASLVEPGLAAAALIAAHAGGRATMPVLMLVLPRARQDGLSAEAGKPPLGSVIAAVMLGMLALALCLGPATALVAALLVVAAVALMAWLSDQQIGGQTGDVLGAVEQVSEILILLVAAAML
ncbi:MAG: adenosylcobinamide-GDP ribazoletransferase [Hyphomicrobiaceae bacterium]|jgi:adenosylcobinamide-GDP ribazoletransferase|nr:adenosylcobinamide-GDP ribazoletransferase [Methyloceanibacter sp.]MDX2317528.1 adenosylcobinamide-GDP ribazoletransferase [Hyphomicrobiaceae bacterium]MDX2449555.1 adenosylcobinamide-GDP ribazoletransferase [Hyphomicrobiaceae bacterium]